MKIWKNNLKRLGRLNEERLQTQQRAIEFDEDKIIKFAKGNLGELCWNGRQIRNAFQTAIALAEFEVRNKPDLNPVMTKRHFAKVSKAAREFDEYMGRVYGMDDEKRAARNYERASSTSKAKSTAKKYSRDDTESSGSSESSASESSSDDPSEESSDSDSEEPDAKSRKRRSKHKGKSKRDEGKEKEKEKKDKARDKERKSTGRKGEKNSKMKEEQSDES